MKLSILIPVLLPRDQESYGRLIEALQRQYAGLDVEVWTDKDNGENSIGEKRNSLLQKANGKYICSIDADDEVSDKYIPAILKAIESNPDCCSLKGIYEIDGVYGGVFHHSIKYKEYKTNDHDYPKFERYPNHLNVIRADIAKQFKFPAINHGEDKAWADKIFESKLLKKETEITEVIYHYKFISNK